jgi:integrase
MTKYAIVKFLDEETPAVPEFISRYRIHARATKCESTMRQSENAALDLFEVFAKKEDLPNLGSISADKADRFKNWMSERFAQNTVRRRMAVIAAVFKYAVSIGITTSNPFDQIELPNPVFGGRDLGDQDIIHLFKFLGSLMVRACRFSLHTGLRRCELLGLNDRWINGRILTVPAVIAKSGEAREIDLDSSAMEILNHWDGKGRPFPISTTMLNKYMTKAWKLSGLGRIRFHDMRHVWATRFMQQHGNIFLLMRQGGWKSVKSVQPYQHITAQKFNHPVTVKYTRGI